MDPFGMDIKKISGSYRLEYFSDGNSYAITKKGDEQLGGIFEGRVIRLAWNNERIVAEVVKHYRGDKDGIYSVDLKTGLIEGPFEVNSEKLMGLTLLPTTEIYPR